MTLSNRVVQSLDLAALSLAALCVDVSADCTPALRLWPLLAAAGVFLAGKLIGRWLPSGPEVTRRTDLYLLAAGGFVCVLSVGTWNAEFGTCLLEAWAGLPVFARALFLGALAAAAEAALIIALHSWRRRPRRGAPPGPP